MHTIKAHKTISGSEPEISVARLAHRPDRFLWKAIVGGISIEQILDAREWDAKQDDEEAQILCGAIAAPSRAAGI